jgi:hypothetical protein
MAPPIIESQSIDQVGAILRGLDLDKKYFYKYVIPNAALKMSSSKSEADPLSPRVEPTSPETAKAATTHAASSQPKEGDTKKAKSVMDKKANTKKGTTALSMAFKPQMDSADFDLYLAESLTPCLAQALDALGRELIRQKETGDKMDRNVLRRFNPRTWIAQYLLRNHPNACQTPRRTAVYADFRKWTDLERGRRELLRRRETITKCFKGFSKRSVVSASDIPKVWATLDEMWYLNGALKNHPQLAISYDGIAPTNLFTLDAFWTWFSQLVMANDILSFAAFKDGHARMLSELEQKEKAVLEAEQREEEEKLRAQQKEEERQRYVEVAEECKQNEILSMIIEKDMILTGAVSSLEPENKAVEVQPFGQHVILLSKLLIVLGFKSLPDPDFVQASRGNKAPTVSRGGKEEEALLEKLDMEQWWEDPALTCWQIVQRAGDTEVQDGVVDRASLQFALDMENYATVSKAITREREKEELLGLGDVVADVAKRQAQQRAQQEAQEELERQMAEEVEKAKGGRKMTYAELCKEYDISITRLEWLHDQFRSFLPEGVEDKYPVDPASLTKVEMRDLYADLKPEMDDATFETAFVEIDKDGSGEIEFDEFVFWLFLEEIPLDEDE